MADAVSRIFQPDVVWALIPIVIVVVIYGNKMLNRYFEHKEKMARIQAGIEPDVEVDEDENEDR